MNDHFSPFFFLLISLFYPFSVVCLPLFSPFFSEKMYCHIKAAQANCPGNAVLLSPKPGAILCQTVDSHFTIMSNTGRSFRAFRLQRNSHQRVSHNLWTSCCVLCWYWSQSAIGEPYNCPPPCTRGFVTFSPSFLALPTSQLLLSFVVFPFNLFSSALTPAEQWIILIISLNDLLISMPVLTLSGLIVMRLFPLWLEVSR